MSPQAIFFSSLAIVGLVAAIWLMLALAQSASTVYYCRCPAVPGTSCWNKVAGPGGMCSACLAGNHRGHM